MEPDYDPTLKYQLIRDKVALHMHWALSKADIWMRTENPILGNTTPLKMILMGRGNKLEKVVDSLIDENSPPKTEKE